MKITASAGHGLYTSGKRCPDDSMREFMFNVAVFNYFKSEIEQYADAKGSKVTVTGVHDPTGKTDISLLSRSNAVNKIAPDLHVDIHANAFTNGWSDANGVETFVYKKSEVQSTKVATAVQNEIVKATGLRNRGVKEGNLHMVRETKNAKAKILVEGPFMSNRKEAELLKSDSFRKLFASAIVKGIVSVYGLKRLNVTTPPVATKPTTSTPVADTQQKYRLLTGTYGTEKAAKNADDLIKKNKIASYTEIKKDGNFFRVQTGTYASKAHAEAAAKKIKDLKIASYVNVLKA